MADLTSHLHHIFRLNGHTFRKFADVDNPIELPTITHVNYKYGRDGALLAARSNIQGGPIAVHLLPTSTSVKFIMQQVALNYNGADIEYNGSYVNSHLGISMTLRGGYLAESKAGSEPESDFDCTFIFEQILPNYDAVKFNEPPLLAGI